MFREFRDHVKGVNFLMMNMNISGDNKLYGIHCDVTNCHYNKQKSCCASEIKVGPQYAASSSDTICATFKPRTGSR